MIKCRLLRKVGNVHGIEVEEITHRHDIYSVDGITGETGVRRTTIHTSNEDEVKLLLSNPRYYRLLSTISHHGHEFDRVHTPEGEPYIDPFGMYVYLTHKLVTKMSKLNDTDERYELDKPVPWSVERECFEAQYGASVQPEGTPENAVLCGA